MSNFSYNNTTMATRVSETNGLSSHVGVIIFFTILAACIGAAIIFVSIYCHYKHVRSTRRLRRKPVCVATYPKARGTRDQRQGGAKREPPQQTKALPLSSIAETDSSVGLGNTSMEGQCETVQSLTSLHNISGWTDSELDHTDSVAVAKATHHSHDKMKTSSLQDLQSGKKRKTNDSQSSIAIVASCTASSFLFPKKKVNNSIIPHPPLAPRLYTAPTLLLSAQETNSPFDHNVVFVMKECSQNPQLTTSVQDTSSQDSALLDHTFVVAKGKHSQPRPHAVLPTSLPPLAKSTIIDPTSTSKVQFANPLCVEATAQSYYSQQAVSLYPLPDLHDITDHETDDGMSCTSYEGTWGSTDGSCTRYPSSCATSSIIHIDGTSSDDGEQQEVWV